jgi:cell division protein ZapA
LAQVDISINGRLYAVACDEGQEARVREMAALVDSRVRQLSTPGATPIGESHFLVLASLMLADELSETRAALAKRERDGPAAIDEEGEALVTAAVDHLANRIADIADRLERA